MAAMMNHGAALWRTLAVAAMFAVTTTIPAFALGEGATHSNLPPGYIAGCVTAQTVTITNSFAYPTSNTLYSLSWTPTLPAGWTLSTNTAGDGNPEINPTNDATIIFTIPVLPTNSPILFSYQVSVPTNETGVKYMGARVEYQYISDANPAQIAAEPDPLPLKMLLTITANSTNKAYGTNLTFAGTEFTASGLVGSDAVTNVTLASAGATNTAAAGTYPITAANAQGTGLTNYMIAYSNGTLTVTSGPITQGTHACAGYYSPSTNMAVSNSFAYPAEQTLTNLVWTPILPNTNWTLISATGDASASVSGSNITFAVTLTNRPVNFTYKVNVPGNAAVSNVVNASIAFAYAGGSGQTAAPDQLTIFRYHGADYQTPFRAIKTVEVNRVLILWRAGNYQPSSAPGDGYEAAATPYTGPDTGRHSADYQTPFWQIKTVEMNRVLMMWRSTGYHVDLAQDDGYMAGMAGPGPSTNGP